MIYWPHKKQIATELRTSFEELSARGLLFAAKWVAEQLYGLDFEVSKLPEDTSTTDKLLEKDANKLILAKAYFDTKEYYRAAHLLKDCASPKASFVRKYALYLAGEKRKHEETIDNSEKGLVVNPELKGLKDELQQQYEQSESLMDGFHLYLYGVILKELDLKAQARVILFKSVNSYPWNWSAWHDIISICTEDDLQSYESNFKGLINDHWMKDFFMANLALELQRNTDSIKLYEEIAKVFSNSTYILSQMAIANYNLREFDNAEQLFEELFEQDPFRIENMDTYSNILYVKENKAKLSYLAHNASETDKYRPETCCIVGNYYSLKSEHEKAVIYFKRALKLNRKFLSAWTLMGHEYVEMKNTRSAIEAYRKAVDINPRDYRAWYGLGQTYELLKMPLYSVYYYNKAAALKPYDARMWGAMAGCYEELGRIPETIKCWEKADNLKDREGIAASRLAKLYHELSEDAKAAFYYKKNLDMRDEEGVEGQDTIDALLFLATYCKNTGDLQQAEQYCSRLLDYAGKVTSFYL